jgi:thiol-disulfide isomerase/thioredoxin
MTFIASTRKPLRSLFRNTLSIALRAALPVLAVLFMAQPAAADEWKLKDTQGVSHTLAGEKGKWVLVNFWAPWCPPCLEEMPGFSELQKKHRDLQVIGVAVMYRKEREVMDVANKQKLAYPVVLGNESIASEFGELAGLPTSFLYDPSGKRVGRHEGPLTAQQVEQAMARSASAKDVFASPD